MLFKATGYNLVSREVMFSGHMMVMMEAPEKIC